MEFIPYYRQSILRKHKICSLGKVDSQSEGGSIGQSELAKKKRPKYLNERINQYYDLARTTNDVRKWLMRSTMTHWKIFDEDMAE